MRCAVARVPVLLRGHSTSSEAVDGSAQECVPFPPPHPYPSLRFKLLSRFSANIWPLVTYQNGVDSSFECSSFARACIHGSWTAQQA
jgi:hypothetical protein